MAQATKQDDFQISIRRPMYVERHFISWTSWLSTSFKWCFSVKQSIISVLLKTTSNSSHV